MKYIISILILFSFHGFSSPITDKDLKSQKYKELLTKIIKLELQMNVGKMKNIIESNNIEFKHVNNTISMSINSYDLIIIYDENADRMRIVCPIIKVAELIDGQLNKALEANFHTALDAKYAVSDGIVWSVFVHPLSDLSESLFQSALEQTYVAAATFGKEYTSGALIFPNPKQESIEKEKTEE